MFDPEDKKRTVVRRSLLDVASGETAASRPRQISRSVPARGAAALLDRLGKPVSEPLLSQSATTAAFAEDKSGTKPKKGRLARFSGWLRRDTAAMTFDHGMAEKRTGGYTTGSPVYEDERDRPLIDIATILSSVWQMRKVILFLTVVGAAGGVLLAMSTPSIYISESKLYVDPREVRLTDSDLSKGNLATEAILALLDSQLEILRSRTVLEKVAVDLNLDRDPEFGTADQSRLAAARDIVSPQEGSAAPASGISPRTLEKLSEALTVGRDPKTFIVTVEVKTHNAQKSALITNRIVSTFLKEEQAAQSGFFQETTAALDDRLAELRKNLDAAENAVETFKAEHDIVGAGGELISDKQLLLLNDQVAAVRNRIAEARAKAGVATNTRLNDVLTGSFPEELSSMTLQELRKQYSEARAQLGALDTSLGPRHPQRMAASQALEVARAEIGNELRRIEAAAQTELKRAVDTEKDLVQQLAIRKANQVNFSGNFITLRELERKANATQAIYESFLKRASETGEEGKLTNRNIRVISRAEPPLQANGPSRKLIAIGGMMAGLMAGIGLGVMLGAYRSLIHRLQRPERRDEPPVEDVPSDGSDPHPDGPGRSPRLPEHVPSMVRQPRREPAAHHASATAAALSALQAGKRDEPSELRSYLREMQEKDRETEGFEQVQAEMRALRSRVEDYARLRAGGR
ncbi:GumC family protein [Pararhizobium gei]|uniref:GumC family protein n=1 Tax=Pararhizobium gei TaxID=1395951 RepID=UPI0023DAACBE|nr:Wzz/FepE/Etk N-terminal domain-containing protein [Rhizobium gei]